LGSVFVESLTRRYPVAPSVKNTRSSGLEMLKGSRLKSTDGVMVFSVGGGNLEKNVSPNQVSALQHAKEVGASILAFACFAPDTQGPADKVGEHTVRSTLRSKKEKSWNRRKETKRGL
jgi:hypothetical protein